MDKSFIDRVRSIKEKCGTEIIDSHIHPHDVMGVVHFSEYPLDSSSGISYRQPGLMERLRFGRTANFLSNNFFNLFVGTVTKEIRAMFSATSQERLLAEMDEALIDCAAFLSVEPWTDTAKIKDNFQDGRFLILGSVDLARTSAEDIAQAISKQKDELGIVGIKLHPNLQDFRPQPEDNSPELGKKLETIYATAEKLGLYLLFHGGLSSFTEYVDSRYQDSARSKDNALLKNFCDEDGKSSLFGRYRLPIVIAHLGHFGLNKLDTKRLGAIIERYPDVYFDTAACSPALIADFMSNFGHERVILGSDAIYNRMAFAMYFVESAVKKSRLSKEQKDNALCAIYGATYRDKILNYAYGSNL